MEGPIVVNRIIVDARRRFAGHNDLWIGLHHALVEFLHLIEGGGGCGEIVCRSIAAGAELSCVDAQGAFLERSGFNVATRLD